MKKRKKSKSAPQSGSASLLRKPWLFAGAVFGLDLAMLIIGLVLSQTAVGGMIYTVSGDSIEKNNPLAFFGVIAAVVLGINCALAALIIAGAFTKKQRIHTILGAVGLILLSLAMIGSSAYMALGAPIKSEKYYSYTDENLRLIAEESEPYFGNGTVSFYLASTEENGRAALLAKTDITGYSDSADRYSISWQSDDILQIAFSDGNNYRTLTIQNVKERLSEVEQQY